MQLERVMGTITDALRDQPVIRSSFLSGSFGNGRADAFSDMDFVLVAKDGPTDEIADAWKAAVARTGEIGNCCVNLMRPCEWAVHWVTRRLRIAGQ